MAKIKKPEFTRDEIKALMKRYAVLIKAFIKLENREAADILKMVNNDLFTLLRKNQAED